MVLIMIIGGIKDGQVIQFPDTPNVSSMSYTIIIPIPIQHDVINLEDVNYFEPLNIISLPIERRRTHDKRVKYQVSIPQKYWHLS